MELRLQQEMHAGFTGIRQEMHAGFTAVRQEMSDLRAETLKWSFAFRISQLAAIAGLLAYMLRAR